MHLPLPPSFLLGYELKHFLPDVVGHPVWIHRLAVGVQLGILQLLVEQLSLPDGVSVVLDVVDEESGNLKLSKSLDVSTDWSIHQQKLCYRWVLVHCMEDGRSSLRVSEHGKVTFVS